MSGTYTPTVWANGTDGGTPITAEALNNMEGGIPPRSRPWAP